MTSKTGGTTVRDLLGKLSTLDEGAESLVRVIAYFDTLVDGHVGLETIVRSAAALGHCTAGVRDSDRQVFMRVDPEGHRHSPSDPMDESSRVVLAGESGIEVWLERTGGPLPTDGMVLERFVSGAAIVVERTFGRAPGRDPAQIELLLDGNADIEVRSRAARRLGLHSVQGLRAVAVLMTRPDQDQSDAALSDLIPNPGGLLSTQIGRVQAFILPGEREIKSESSAALRAGIGTLGPLRDLPQSWREAVTALRLTAAGTTEDPGARTLSYEDLGGLAALAESFDLGSAPIRDVEALNAAAAMGPWALVTLDAVADCSSMRQAANRLYVHHSTVQQRFAQLESAVGFKLDSGGGRFRLQLALALRRLLINGPLP
jgi:hypothetical protein